MNQELVKLFNAILSPLSILVGILTGLISIWGFILPALRRLKSQHKSLDELIYIPKNDRKLNAYLKARRAKKMKHFVLLSSIFTLSIILLAACSTAVIIVDNKISTFTFLPNFNFNVPDFNFNDVTSHLHATVVTSYSGHSYPVNKILWSPKGSYIASSDSNGVVHIWNAITGRDIAFFRDPAEYSSISDLSWSYDEKFIASVGGNGNIIVWNATTGYVDSSYSANGYALSVAWSPSGSFIASAGLFGEVQVWNRATKQETSFSAVGPTCKNDLNSALAYVNKNPKLYKQYIPYIRAYQCEVKSISWSHGGGYLAVIIDGEVRIWDAGTQKFITTFGKKVNALTWNPSQPNIATANDDGTVKIWNALTGKIADFSNTDISEPGKKMISIAWSPDDMYLAYCRDDGTIEVVSPNAGLFGSDTTIKLSYNTSTGCDTLAWSPDSNYLASNDGAIIQVRHLMIMQTPTPSATTHATAGTH